MEKRTFFEHLFLGNSLERKEMILTSLKKVKFNQRLTLEDRFYLFYNHLTKEIEVSELENTLMPLVEPTSLAKKKFIDVQQEPSSLLPEDSFHFLLRQFQHFFHFISLPENEPYLILFSILLFIALLPFFFHLLKLSIRKIYRILF